MANITDIIAGLFPGISVDTPEKSAPVVTVDDSKWHEVAAALRDTKGLQMDYLVTIVGMDWPEGLGCMYYLMSSVTNEIVGVKVLAKGDREQPSITSVADIWKVATLYEREVYDFFGIVFVGNPDMRRLFLSIDWKGYPLRKDYDANPDLNPVSIHLFAQCRRHTCKRGRARVPARGFRGEHRPPASCHAWRAPFPHCNRR